MVRERDPDKQTETESQKKRKEARDEQGKRQFKDKTENLLEIETQIYIETTKQSKGRGTKQQGI